MLEVQGGLHLEIAPEKLNCKFFEGHIHTEKFIAEAEETKAAASHKQLIALKDAVVALHTNTAAISQANIGTKSQRAAIKTSNAAVESKMNAVTSIT